MNFLLLFLLTQIAHASPTIDASRLHVVETCRATKATKLVYFIKQWHLSPSVNTETDPSSSRKLPQYKNQRAIYDELDSWIQAHELNVLYAEGCPIPKNVDGSLGLKFNGWSLEALAAYSKRPEFADVVTNVAFKLEAKWGDRLKAHCGDDADALRRNMLAFSDARGVLGYLTRIQEFEKDPKRVKLYLDGVIELYHLPAGATITQAEARLGTELKKSVGEIEKWIEVRNQKLVDAIAGDPSPVVAVVFGGAHASGVKKLLEEKGLGCTVLEPAGYHDDEAEMLSRLHALVNGV